MHQNAPKLSILRTKLIFLGRGPTPPPHPTIRRLWRVGPSLLKS